MSVGMTQIPSVQVGAGIPLQSSVQQTNMAPVTSGSLLQLPPGTLVPVKVGNSIVMAPTQPVANQPVQPQYEVETYQVPVQSQQEYVPGPNVYPAPQYQQETTPQLRTLQPKIVKNQLPPQHKQVVLPAKVVTTHLPPIGPPPTPELDIPLPPVQPVAIPEPVTVPVRPVQTVLVPKPVTYQIPVQSVAVPNYQVVSVPNYQTTSVPNYQTATQFSAPKYGSTSVIAQY